MNVGILGCGAIAQKMAETLKKMEDENVHLLAFASRSIDKAKDYSKRFSVETAYGSYEELAKDDRIDLIYIATPHSEHLSNMLLCFDHHRNVLVEKAFTANAVQAEKALLAAKEKNCFLAEAIWTRYMPMRRKLDSILSSGRIGKIRYLTADLGYLINGKKRLVDPSLAGGSLLDVGIYPLNFALMHMPGKISEIRAFCNKTASGVDMSEGILIAYDDGAFASLTATMECVTPRQAAISGTEGFLVVENVNNPEEIRVYDSDRRLIERVERENIITGYEYEIRECQKALSEGKKECPSTPWSETLSTMRLLDDIRRRFGVVYPFERF